MTPSASEILSVFPRNPNLGGELLFKRYYKPLVLFADSLLTDIHFSEDIVQDVFYDFIKQHAWRQVTPVTLTAYLFRCVRNACLNRLRNRRVVMDAELLKFEAAEEEAMTISPELIAAIRKTIEQLPEKTRKVIVSILIQGKKYKETAEELNVSVNTVKTLLSHGVKQLREQFPDTLLLLFYRISQLMCTPLRT